MRFINFIEPPYKVAIDLAFPLTELIIKYLTMALN